jgi:hypothetical protein
MVAGPPIVTAGLAWSLDLSAGDLVGADLKSGREVSRLHLGSLVHFAPLASGGGRLVVPVGHGVVGLAG